MARDLIPPPSPAGKPEGDWEKERAKEADSEAKALKATATDRKEAIQGKLEALA